MNLFFSGNSMNNLLSYCGLTDSRMRASEKGLPVQIKVPLTPLVVMKMTRIIQKVSNVNPLLDLYIMTRTSNHFKTI